MIAKKNTLARNLNGSELAKEIRITVKQTIEKECTTPYPPSLSVILVGEDSASAIYVEKKRQACIEVGIQSQVFQLPASVTEEKLLTLITDLNTNPEISGILVQLPLPSHIQSEKILEAISPSKDVDGFHPYNVGRLAQRSPVLRPCTPKGIVKLLEKTQVNLKGLHAVVVGASNIVGRPAALELLLAGCTTTICHRFTQNLPDFVGQADILIAAAGKPHLIQGEWLKPGCIGIDVGIHRDESGKIIGDLQQKTAREICSWLTPVPGGVGPMTVACLLENTWTAHQLQSKSNKTLQ